MRKKLLKIYVDEDLYSVLKILSESNNRSLSNFCGLILSTYVFNLGGQNAEH